MLDERGHLQQGEGLSAEVDRVGSDLLDREVAEPALLATRCLHGALDGTVGPGPLARLLDGAWCAVLLFVALARSLGRGDCLYLAGSQVALEVFERRVS